MIKHGRLIFKINCGPMSKKFTFFNFHFALVKLLSACCGLNFDATDLPRSLFQLLYPNGFLVSCPGVNSLASRSSQSEEMPIFFRLKKAVSGVFFDKSIFPIKRLTLADSMSYIFGKLMYQRSILGYLEPKSVHPTKFCW